MKQLLVIRHAKSSWAQIGQTDFARPLNERGKSDAPMMAQRLLERKITIDAFISSPANRAFTTATYFAEAYGLTKKQIQQVGILYHALPPVFFEVISEIENEINSAAIFSHNPGITEFVNQLTNTRLDNMPTCGIFTVTADIKEWKDFAKTDKKFSFFDYPKR